MATNTANGNAAYGEVAKRYATALLDLAEEKGQLDSLYPDVNALVQMIADSDDFNAFLANPLLLRAAQVRAVLAVADKCGFQPLMKNFLGLVAQNRRLSDLPDIARALQSDMAARQGEVTADVVSARELSAAQNDKIRDTLSKSLGATVKLNTIVDPDIMGGLIVKVGSKLIDNSVRTRLDRLHRAMKSHNNTIDKAKMREVA